MKFCQEDFERLVAHHAFTHRFLQSGKGTRRTADGIHVLERLRDPFPGINPGKGSTKRWLKRCDRYKNRPICGQRQTIAELLEAEQRELLSLLKQRFEAARVKILRADYFSTIGVDGNRYFVPVEYTGRNVTVKQLSAWKFFPGRKDRLLRTLLRQRADHMLP